LIPLLSHVVFCVICTYSVLHAAVRSLDRQLVIIVSSVQFSSRSTAEDDGGQDQRTKKGSRQRKQVCQPSHLINRLLHRAQLMYSGRPAQRCSSAWQQQQQQTRESRRTATGDDVDMGSRAHAMSTRSLNDVRAAVNSLRSLPSSPSSRTCIAQTPSRPRPGRPGRHRIQGL